MPFFERDNIKIYYEESGQGFPVLLFAPGGMRSAIKYWHESEFKAIEELSGAFRVIAMDQRNAGQSIAPVSGSDNWDTYTSDHVALLDHLGIQKTHVMGGCIGGAICGCDDDVIFIAISGVRRRFIDGARSDVNYPLRSFRRSKA